MPARGFGDAEGGQAYIATAVALGALLVAMFAAPAITYASLSSSPAGIEIAAPFEDEVADILRMIGDAGGLRAEINVPCTVEFLPNETGVPNIPSWTCTPVTDCGATGLTDAINETVREVRPFVAASISVNATADQSECVADGCTEGGTQYVMQDAIDLRVRLNITSARAHASFDEDAFGGLDGAGDVRVLCNHVT